MDPLQLLQLKMSIKKSILKAIEKYSKQESIIIKVLDIINNTENKEMFEQKDNEIEEKYEVIKKEWEEKRQKFEMYKRLRENFSDFDYFASNAMF